MWFLFGFVTITCAISFEFHRRYSSRWKATDKREGYEYTHQSSKSRITGLLLGIGCVPDANFMIKRQSWVDSFFKRIGVSSEFDTGDPAFDDAYYLVTDNKSLHKSLADNPRFRAAITKIMEFRAAQLKTTAIHCRNGRVWIDFSAEFLYSEENVASVVRSLGGFLDVITAAIADLSKASGARWKDPFVIKAAMLLALSSGLAINVVLQLLRHNFTYIPFTLNYTNILWDAFLYSLLMVPVVLLLAVYWLGRSARTHLVLIELGSIGAVSLVLSLALEMRDINIGMDTKNAESYKTVVVDKSVSKTRRSTSYYLTVKDWRCNCGNIKFQVSHDTYNSLPAGTAVNIAQHSGYFGYPWIAGVKAL